MANNALTQLITDVPAVPFQARYLNLSVALRPTGCALPDLLTSTQALPPIELPDVQKDCVYNWVEPPITPALFFPPFPCPAGFEFVTKQVGIKPSLTLPPVVVVDVGLHVGKDADDRKDICKYLIDLPDNVVIPCYPAGPQIESTAAITVRNGPDEVITELEIIRDPNLPCKWVLNGDVDITIPEIPCKDGLTFLTTPWEIKYDSYSEIKQIDIVNDPLDPCTFQLQMPTLTIPCYPAGPQIESTAVITVLNEQGLTESVTELEIIRDPNLPCKWVLNGDVDITIPCKNGLTFPPALWEVNSASYSETKQVAIVKDPLDPCTFEVQMPTLTIPCYPDGPQIESTAAIKVRNGPDEVITELEIIRDPNLPCKWVLNGDVDIDITIPCKNGLTFPPAPWEIKYDSYSEIKQIDIVNDPLDHCSFQLQMPTLTIPCYPDGPQIESTAVITVLSNAGVVESVAELEIIRDPNLPCKWVLNGDVDITMPLIPCKDGLTFPPALWEVNSASYSETKQVAIVKDPLDPCVFQLEMPTLTIPCYPDGPSVHGKSTVVVTDRGVIKDTQEISILPKNCLYGPSTPGTPAVPGVPAVPAVPAVPGVPTNYPFSLATGFTLKPSPPFNPFLVDSSAANSVSVTIPGPATDSYTINITLSGSVEVNIYSGFTVNAGDPTGVARGGSPATAGPNLWWLQISSPSQRIWINSGAAVAPERALAGVVVQAQVNGGATVTLAYDTTDGQSFLANNVTATFDVTALSPGSPEIPGSPAIPPIPAGPVILGPILTCCEFELGGDLQIEIPCQDGLTFPIKTFKIISTGPSIEPDTNKELKLTKSATDMCSYDFEFPDLQIPCYPDGPIVRGTVTVLVGDGALKLPPQTVSINTNPTTTCCFEIGSPGLPNYPGYPAPLGDDIIHIPLPDFTLACDTLEFQGGIRVKQSATSPWLPNNITLVNEPCGAALVGDIDLRLPAFVTSCSALNFGGSIVVRTPGAVGVPSTVFANTVALTSTPCGANFSGEIILDIPAFTFPCPNGYTTLNTAPVVKINGIAPTVNTLKITRVTDSTNSPNGNACGFAMSGNLEFNTPGGGGAGAGLGFNYRRNWRSGSVIAPGTVIGIIGHEGGRCTYYANRAIAANEPPPEEDDDTWSAMGCEDGKRYAPFKVIKAKPPAWEPNQDRKDYVKVVFDSKLSGGTNKLRMILGINVPFVLKPGQLVYLEEIWAPLASQFSPTFIGAGIAAGPYWDNDWTFGPAPAGGAAPAAVPGVWPIAYKWIRPQSMGASPPTPAAGFTVNNETATYVMGEFDSWVVNKWPSPPLWSVSAGTALRAAYLSGVVEIEIPEFHKVIEDTAMALGTLHAVAVGGQAALSYPFKSYMLIAQAKEVGDTSSGDLTLTDTAGGKYAVQQLLEAHLFEAGTNVNGRNITQLRAGASPYDYGQIELNTTAAGVPGGAITFTVNVLPPPTYWTNAGEAPPVIGIGPNDIHVYYTASVDGGLMEPSYDDLRLTEVHHYNPLIPPTNLIVPPTATPPPTLSIRAIAYHPRMRCSGVQVRNYIAT